MDKGLNNFSYKLFFKNYKKNTQQSPDKWPKDHITVQEKKYLFVKMLPCLHLFIRDIII